MDRELTVRMSNDWMQGRVNTNDASECIRDYCLEYNKDPQKTELFIQYVITHSMISCIKEALEYYQRKFNVLIIEVPEGEGRFRAFLAK